MVLLMELVHHQVTIQHKDDTISQGCIVDIDEEFVKLVNLKDEISYISISDISRAKLGLNKIEKSQPKVVMTRAKPKPPQYQDVSNQPGLNDGNYQMPSFITGGDRDFIQESD